VNKEQEEYMQQHREEIRQSLEQLKGIAINIRDLLVSRNPANVREIGSHLHRAWEIKKGLGKTVSNQEVDVIYEAGMKSGATGGKLLGAGEGGYILFFTPPEKRYKLQKVMQQYSSETLEFRFERNPTGSRVWEVHK
jgi:D-glycero-alpha-D-manno-heptose-7-phosphate kinase